MAADSDSCFFFVASITLVMLFLTTYFKMELETLGIWKYYAILLLFTAYHVKWFRLSKSAYLLFAQIYIFVFL